VIFHVIGEGWKMVSVGHRRAAISPRLELIVVLALLTAAIVLRLVFIQGYVDSDPAYYAGLANDLANGKWNFIGYDSALAFPLRLGLYAPVALFIKMFGLSENVLTIFPFIVSVASCLLAYFLARNLFGSKAGWISLALSALLPTDVVMASTLYPDMIAAFWANLGIGLLILDPAKDTTRRSLSLSMLAGLCLGMAWLSKESVVYLGPFVPFYLFQRKAPIPHLACVGATALSVLFAEAAFYRAMTGDWLYHFHTVQRNYVQNAVWFFDQSSPYFGWEPGGYGKALIRRMFLSGPRELLKAFRGVPAFAIVGLAWGILAKDRRFVMLGAWLIVLMLMFNFGSSSLTSYRPLPLYFERYLYPVLLPAVLLIAGLLALLVEAGQVPDLAMERRFWATVFAAGVLATIVIGIKDLRPHPQQLVHDVVPNLRPSDIVYTDLKTARALTFFRTGQLSPSAPTVIPYEHLALGDMPSGSYVLLSQGKIDFVVGPTGTKKYEAPEFATTLPPAWRTVWSEGELTLYRINENAPAPDEAISSRSR
jgi:4-amino-4-deoxy-L-arabinose transferase-like glycosyltransferase